MLGYLVLIILAVPVLAAVLDRHDARRGRTRRAPSVMAAERRDLHADLESTQHHGIAVPIDDICRDRQKRR